MLKLARRLFAIAPVLCALPSASGAELSLKAAGSVVALDSESEAQLVAALESYFQSCHDHASVVGEPLPQEDLGRRWAEQEPLAHALVHQTFGPDAPPSLRGKTLDVLIGFDSGDGPSPVLARDESNVLTSYIKCPGLDGLVLSCQVHRLIPGMSPNAECDQWENLRAGIESQSAGQQGGANRQPPPPTTGDQELARGELLYRVHCASCHGKQGEGDGPMVPVLRVRPTDLTRLERRAGGEFPEDDVEASIDGRTEVRGHGTREMPVWGLTFVERGRDTPQEREVDAEIRALVRYLRSLQRR